MKSLEELIKFSAETEQEAYVMRKTAAEILRVAEGKCFILGKEKVVQLQDLYEFIQPVKEGE